MGRTNRILIAVVLRLLTFGPNFATLAQYKNSSRCIYFLYLQKYMHLLVCTHNQVVFIDSRSQECRDYGRKYFDVPNRAFLYTIVFCTIFTNSVRNFHL